MDKYFEPASQPLLLLAVSHTLLSRAFQKNRRSKEETYMHGRTTFSAVDIQGEGWGVSRE